MILNKTFLLSGSVSGPESPHPHPFSPFLPLPSCTVPQSLLVLVPSQHCLFLIWLRILERKLTTSVFYLGERQPHFAQQADARGPLLTTSTSSFSPPSTRTYLFCHVDLYAGFCAWRATPELQSLEWIKPGVGSRP